MPRSRSSLPSSANTSPSTRRPDSLFAARLAEAVAEFGNEVAAKLATGAGSPEDHLRGPLEGLLHKASEQFGLRIVTVGEARLPDLGARPDYAIEVGGARVGYIEIKKPGRGVPTTWTPTRHDQEQWNKLSLLPNVLYTDGEQWALYRSGTLTGEVVRLVPALRQAGRRLRAESGDFERLLWNFLTWQPERPRSVRQLVRAIAGLCRLLRDEVNEIIRRENSGRVQPARFTTLAHEWRGLLFPNLTDEQFADAYAQTVTFALLLARVEGIEFGDRSVGEIALLLGKKHSLMGKALGVLVNGTVEPSIAIDTLIRVIAVVQWEDFDRDTYILLFEHFLATYDPGQRKRSGSYYTPDEVVASMVRFVDQVLRKHLGRPRGLAQDDVIVVDPAMGTGSFLARVVDRVAETVHALEGPGQVAPRLRALSRRLIGFENQAAPYAVAQLRLQSLLKNGYGAEVPQEEFRFLTDALDNPNLQELGFGSVYDEIKRSRTGANRVKRDVPVMVVIGNPPYRERARGLGTWIEERGADRVSRPNLDAFRAPGHGRYEYVLSNLYVYFWRWATWKVFDAHPDQPSGVVAFITTSSFTTGTGFAGMREYFRRTADEGWVIDLTPEGHRPPVNTRIFPATQHPLCIAVFVRRGSADPDTPAHIHHTSVEGLQIDKFSQLAALDIDGPEWTSCRTGWQDPFTPDQHHDWRTYPTLPDLMPWTAPGVKPNRTWVYAPSPETLRKRWDRLVAAPSEEKPVLFKESSAADLNRVSKPLHGHPQTAGPLRAETGPCPPPARVAFRSFDRQWIIPDSRLINRPRPDIWQVCSKYQVFTTEQNAHVITDGPGLTFAAYPPDMHHFNSRGGRVIPLYRDGSAKSPNVTPGLCEYLSQRLGLGVTAEDLLAYIASVTAHPYYVQRFREELTAPGIRIPLTVGAQAWRRAVKIGREVIWVHTYGERYCDAMAGRPQDVPQLPPLERPRVTVTIPDDPEHMPDLVDYDARTETLIVGTGRIQPVRREVWEYEVSGRPIVGRWFSFRRKHPAGRRSSPLDDINSESWTAETTGELLDLLNVLGRCIALHPQQVEVLDEILEGPLITEPELRTAGLLPVPSNARKPAPATDMPTLWKGIG